MYEKHLEMVQMKELESYSDSVKVFLDSFRRKYPTERVLKFLKGIGSIRVLVIGETILDEYHHVVPIGKPPKGNHIAARYVRHEIHAGGVLACANHLASFCREVHLATIIGSTDNSEEFIREKLKPNIHPKFFYQNRTIVKRRFIDQAYQNKIFEIYENEEPYSADVSESISRWILPEVNNYRYNLIIVLDYGHNLFDKNLIKTICHLPNFLAVNAQTNTSNFGYNLITKYPRANYFCLDEWELRLAFQDRDGTIDPLIRNLGKKISLPGVVSVTRGHLGSITHNPQSGELFESPVFSKRVVDTTGAGDAFLAVTAPLVANNSPAELVSFVGNVAGALAVGYLGNKSPIESEDLCQFIQNLLD